MVDNIDDSLLVSLVKERPVIWNKYIEEYKDKARTFEAWREICATLNENFATLTNGEKILYGKALTKRWNSLRDGWMKCHKKLLNKTPEEIKKVKKYANYDQMIFLSKIAPSWGNSNTSITNNSTSTSEDRYSASDDGENDSSNLKTSFKFEKVEPIEINWYVDEDNESNPSPSKKKRIEIEKSQIKDYVTSEVDARLLKLINTFQEKDKCTPIMSFFKSIEPSVAKFNDTELVEFQCEVMNAIRNIQQQNHLMK